eukprot:762571-Hanusia_phi.AAC.1
MSVTVSKSAGIELPAGGLTTSADFDRVTIRAEAKGALVLETPFLWTGGSIQRVGTLQQSSIRFDSTACSSADVSGISRSCIRAGSTVSVKVSFTASMPFRANESFTLCMPGFRGPENVSYVTLINSTVAIRNNRGLWDPTGCDGAASLSFEYLDGIAANVQSCVAISAGAGIRLPALGVSYDTGLFIRPSSPSFGVVAPSLIESVQNIGSFLISSISFDIPEAGVRSRMNLTLVSSLDIHDGAFFQLKLPSFAVVDVSYSINGFASIRSGSWSNEESLLSFSIPATSKNSTLLVLFHEVQIPVEGLTIRSPKIEIGTNFSTSVVCFTEISDVPAIYQTGNFTTFDILFNNPQALKHSNISIRFQAEMTIFPGSILHILFPGFVSEDRSLEVMNTPFSNVQWIQIESSMTLTVGKLIDSLEIVDLEIDFDFLIPEIGVQKCGILVFINATSGPINHGICPRFTPIGAFLNSNISFEPALAGKQSEIRLQFQAQMKIRPGESILVNLPFFERKTQGMNDNNQLYWMHNGQNISSVQTQCILASWNGSSFQLRLEVCLQDIPAKADVEIVIPSSFGLRLPASGLLQNQPSLKMSCDAEAGRVLPTSIQEISGVGYFSKSSLSFLDASDDGERFVQAGRIVRLRLEVEIGMKLYPNDELVLALPDFMLTATSSDLVNASSINETSLPFYVSIRPASREVVLTSTAELEASTSLTFVLPSRLEIALPERGVAPNQADLTLEARSPSRPVAATPLDTVQAVGAFLNASLTFDPPVAGSKADLYLNFTCAMEILENESITLRLPDFSSNLSSTILQDAIKGVLVKATWDGETNQLTLVYLNQTRRNQAFEFKVLQMFVLPRLG